MVTLFDYPTEGYSRNEWGGDLLTIITRHGIDPTATRYGLHWDNTAAENRAALLAAKMDADAEGVPLRVPPGEYAMDANTNIGETPFIGTGSDRTVFTRSSGGNTPTFYVNGTIGTAVSLTADAAAGDTTLTVSSASGFASGDLVYLTSTRTVGTSAGPVGYELAHVDTASGTTVTLQDALLHPFATADGSAVAKLTPARPHLSGFGIRVEGSAEARGLQLYVTEGAVVEDYQISDYYTNGLDLRISSGGRVSGYRADDPTATTSGLGYGINVREGSRDLLIEQLEGHRNRHLIVVTGASSYITVRHGHGYGSLFGDFDSHGHECRFLLWDDCHGDSVIGSFNAGNASYSWDADITYQNCTGRGAIADPFGGHFQFSGGATRITLNNPQTHLGNAAIYANGASKITVQGGRLRAHTRAVDAADTTGVKLLGTTIESTTSNAVRSQGTSDYWVLDAGLEYISCAAGASLVGANNTTGTVVTR